AYVGQAEADSTLVPKAKALLEDAARAMPQNWRPVWYLGVIADLEKNDSLSTAYFEQVTRLGGEAFEAWWIVGTRAFEAGDHAKVLDLMEKAKKLFPNDFRSYLLLGLSYSQQSKNEEAVVNLRKSLELNPEDVNALGSLALILDGMKRFEESDSLYERALVLDPSSSINLNNYSYSLAERGLQLDRALEMSKKAVADDSLNSSYLDTLGWIYYKLGMHGEAALYIEKAIEAGDASSVVHEHLGDVHFKLGQQEKAMEYWRKALDLDAKNELLKAKIERGLP
ncbi:MAG TPA: tetratricopeptide repeat protein, partial [Bacteroidota bacterium]